MNRVRLFIFILFVCLCACQAQHEQSAGAANRLLTIKISDEFAIDTAHGATTIPTEIGCVFYDSEAMPPDLFTSNNGGNGSQNCRDDSHDT